MTPSDSPADPRLDPRILEREGLDPATVEAVGKLSEALETIEVARGHLYAFHQLTGHADFQVEDSVELLRNAGHSELADTLARELVGRNVLPGRWTFQIVEEFEETYYEPFRELERRSRELTNGHHHLYEAGLKRQRRTAGQPGHEPTPQEPVQPDR
ncbi:MAG TPA: hypothetical protein VGE14_03925 [Marmoricola sp.]